MTVANFAEAEKAVVQAFEAAFAEAPNGSGPLDYSTQISIGTGDFSWPAGESAVQFSVYEVGARRAAQGENGDDRIDCEAMLEIRVPDDGSGASDESSDLHVLSQLFKDTFKGADIDGCLFERPPQPRGQGQDGRWVTRIYTAPFFFYEARS